MADTAYRVNARVWHPWVRISRLIITIRSNRWDAATWPAAKAVLLDAMKERSRVHHAGWFNWGHPIADRVRENGQMPGSPRVSQARL